MKIAHLAPDKEATYGGEHRVAQVLIHRRHGVGAYLSGKAIADDKVISRPELLHKWVQRAEVVAIVRVSHDDVPASRCCYSTTDSAAVSFLGHGDQPGASGQYDLLRAVCATVIRYYYLAMYVALFQVCECLVYAQTHGTALVETGHHYGELRYCGQIMKGCSQ